MSREFLILTIFTVISQMAAGAFIFREIQILSDSPGIDSDGYRRKSLSVILALLGLSLLISFLHLGNPLHALKAINNLKSSWLSREILFLCLFSMSLVICYVYDKPGKPVFLRQIIRALSFLTCILFLYSMIRLYLFPSIRSWYHPATPVAFILTTILSGFTLFPALSMIRPDTVYSRMYPLIFVLVLFSLLNSGIYYHHISGNLPVIFLLRVSVPLLAVLIIPLLNFKKLLNKYGLWPVILFLMLFTGEFLGRIIFFLTFDKSGL